MPIRPENKARYPKDWPAISQRIRLRAGNKCEFCGVPNHQLGAWINGHWHVAWPKGSGERDRPRQGEEFPCHRGEVVEWRKVVRVVLTVAHLDHKPENCADENLKALCQRCHNVYDMPMRRAGIAERARAKCADADLFDVGAAQ
jgi:5-methylcytosine-specific restriction endonuclease McrA